MAATRLARRIRRWLRRMAASTGLGSESGVAAVEFALVAPMFFALLFAIIETGLMFFANQVLETLTQDSARVIQTGQAMTPGGISATQTGPLTAAQFQSQVVCANIPALLSCDKISIDVESYPPTQAWPASFSNQIDSNGNFISNNLQYNTGGPCDVVIVRLFYQWPLFVTGLGYNISNLAGNKRLLWGSAAFRNEPYAGACPSS